jgi:hypothetical protein
VIKTRPHKNPEAPVFSCVRRQRSLLLGLHVLILVSGMLWLTAASSASSQNKSAASPQLVIDGTRRDFGEVFIGEELSHVFTVQNVGTAPLELANKTLTSQSFNYSASPAGSRRTYNAFSNYLRPVAAIKRVAAPT